MGHSVQLIIGRGEAVAAFLRQWPGSRSVELRGDWMAIPVEDALYSAVEAKAPGATRPPELDVSPLGLELALAEATREGGGLAYVETEYFGGQGEQSAMAFADGREAMAAQRSRGGGGPINQALRRIGVVRGADDEFDTVGLGERRSMSDYEPEGTVRLRGVVPARHELEPGEGKTHLPMWLVLVFVALAIGGGVFMAVAR